MKINTVLKKSTLTLFTLSTLILSTQSCSTKKETNATAVNYQDYYKSEFYHAAQMAHFYPDSKTFADATPHLPLKELLVKYENEKATPDFDLKAFIEANFEIPQPFQANFVSDRSKTRKSCRSAINRLMKKKLLEKKILDGELTENSAMLTRVE